MEFSAFTRNANQSIGLLSLMAYIERPQCRKIKKHRRNDPAGKSSEISTESYV